jgi:uncharacterized oxidoreductase
MSDHPPTVSFSADGLVRYVTSVLEATGSPPDLAATVAASLIEANLAGHDSHGIMLLPRYVRAVQAGRLLPAARPEVLSRHQATAIVDGKWGWGQVAARLATETVCALAVQYGVGTVTVRHCHHIGRLGAYVEAMARAGLTGIALCNAGLIVAPYGGRERRLGTNPIAWAAPTARPDQPLVLDVATSAVAGGKIDVAAARGETLAPGLIVDARGVPSTAPADYHAGGALLPFGGHKGYALSVMVELLGGALSGAAPACLPEYDHSNGTLMVAFDIGVFQPPERFVDQAERLTAALKGTPPAAGFDEVAVPGEPEARARRQRAARGIPLPPKTVNELDALAAQLGVATLAGAAMP